MDIISLPLQTVEELTSSTSNITHFIKKDVLDDKFLQRQQCRLIHSLLATYYCLMSNRRKGQDSIYFILFVCLMLTCHVVAAVHHHRQLNDKTTNSSNELPRRGRYSTQSGTSSFILRPEFLTVPIGGVIHLFPRYGYLSLSMKVIARNNSNPHTSNAPARNESWLFLEPVNNVIDPSTMKVEETTFSASSDIDPFPFHHMFHFDLCEDIRMLMEAYFKNFSIEGLDKSWQAFAGGWRPASIARNLGMEQEYVEGDYRYILVKVLMVKGAGSVKPMENATVTQGYISNFQKFKPDNDLSTYEFFKVVGTHYIQSYIVGNSIYQVFVYDPDGFHAVKQKLLLDGIKNGTIATSAEPIVEILSKWVKHTGRIIILNAEANVTEKVRNALTLHDSPYFLKPNLFNMHANVSLVKRIESLLVSQPNGILGINLQGIQFLFNDPIKREGFEKALKHKMQLWEINFLY